MVIEADFWYRGTLKPLVKDRVEHIMLHHAKAKKASAQEIHQWHLSRGWFGFGYNEYIRKDGTVYIGRGTHEGAHCIGMNDTAYGICCEGDFDEETSMQPEQFEALTQRITALMKQYPRAKYIVPHKDYFATSCPGKNFPLEKIKQEVLVNAKEIERDVLILHEKGILSSPEYWNKNAKKGKQVDGHYAAILIRKVAELLSERHVD